MAERHNSTRRAGHLRLTQVAPPGRLGREQVFSGKEPPRRCRIEKASRHRPPAAVSAAVAYPCPNRATLRPGCDVAEPTRFEYWRIRVPFRSDRRRVGAVAGTPWRVGVRRRCDVEFGVVRRSARIRCPGLVRTAISARGPSGLPTTPDVRRSRRTTPARRRSRGRVGGDSASAPRGTLREENRLRIPRLAPLSGRTVRRRGRGWKARRYAACSLARGCRRSVFFAPLSRSFYLSQRDDGSASAEKALGDVPAAGHPDVLGVSAAS